MQERGKWKLAFFLFHCTLIVNMAVTKKAIELTDNYITQKALNREAIEDGHISKKEIMKKAGYSEESIRTNNPELTKLYTVKVEELINKTGFTLKSFVDAIELDVRKGEIDKLDFQQKVKTLSLITSIFKGLSPTYKQKSMVKDEEGNVKTVWTKIN